MGDTEQTGEEEMQTALSAAELRVRFGECLPSKGVWMKCSFPGNSVLMLHYFFSCFERMDQSCWN